jgi:hypothetical protein
LFTMRRCQEKNDVIVPNNVTVCYLLSNAYL